MATKSVGVKKGESDSEKVSIRQMIATTFLEVTTIHAIPDYTQARNTYSRVFWLVLFVFCAIIGSWQVGLLVVHYMNQPYYIANLEVSYKDTAEFPGVTLCNFNKADANKLKKLNMTIDEALALWSSIYEVETAFSPNSNRPDVLRVVGLIQRLYNGLFERYKHGLHEFESFVGMKDHRIAHWKALVSRLQEANESVEVHDLFNATAVSCEQIVHGCLWNGEYVEDCCKYAKPVFREQGLCYTFTPPTENGQNRPQQKRPGTSNGLVLYLETNMAEYVALPDVSELISENQSYMHIVQQLAEISVPNGFLLEIDYDHASTIMTNPILLPLNTHNLIALQKRVEEYEQQFYFTIFQADCVKEGTYEFQYVDGIYTQGNCLMECLQRVMYEQCRCVLLGQVRNEHLYRTCDPIDIFNCFVNATTYRGEEVFGSLSSCRKQCRHACSERFHVDYKLSSTDYPGIYSKDMDKLLWLRVIEVLENEFLKEYGLNNTIDFWMAELKRTRSEKYHRPNSTVSLAELLTKEYLRGDVLLDVRYTVVDIYFDEHTFVKTVHHEKEDVLELIAEIGGHFGLWLGVSVVSLIQVLYYLVAWIFKLPVQTSQIHNPKPVVGGNELQKSRLGPLWFHFGHQKERQSVNPVEEERPTPLKSVTPMPQTSPADSPSPYPSTPPHHQHTVEMIRQLTADMRHVFKTMEHLTHEVRYLQMDMAEIQRQCAENSATLKEADQEISVK